MSKEIIIVDRGRGPQLSTSRITVQNVVPYLQQQFTHEQIREILPGLSVEETQVIERYVAEHYDEVMEQDRRIRERAAARRNPPEVEEILRGGSEKMEALRERFKSQRSQPERNGDFSAG